MLPVTPLITLAVVVGVYYGVVGDLPKAGLWWEIAWLAALVIPAVCGFALLLLPLARQPVARNASIGAAFLGLAVICGVAGVHQVANFAKLGAMTFLAWAFLWFFEELSWVVLVTFIVPWVDAYSVWRGPTKEIVNHHQTVFSAFSFTFPVPDGATHLGLPDLFFFALFLAAVDRFGLRLRTTWLALSLSFGITMAIAIETNAGGLPALPLLSLGFLLPNADILWRRLRRSRRDLALE
ncbi:MAG: hypothetical protein JO017_02325 [Actinobacteria bacterium]|nr:hypothetical protein [Actinomycetota bacterium]